MNLSIKEVIDLLKGLSKKKVVVVGDLLLDEYCYGKVSKVSTGIQIPIIEKEKTKYRLGGAANLASNISEFTSSVVLIGSLGKDDAGRMIGHICNEKKIRVIHKRSDKTIVKQRIYVDNQQIGRVDSECNSDSVTDELIDLLKEFTPDIIVISDYMYGAVSQDTIDVAQEYAQNHNTHLLLASRNPNRFDIARVQVIVMNSIEYEKSLNIYCNQELFVTLGNRGIKYISGQSEIVDNTETRYPLNVSGAGDTVLAVISLLYGEGIYVKDILEIANIAGGIAVSSALTYSVSIAEIIDAIYARETRDECERKIISLDSAQRIITAWKEQNKKIVFTNGCYDLVHFGHIKSFRYAKKFGDKLVVAINSDSSVKRLKGELRPVNNIEERTGILSYLGMIDMIIVFDDDTAVNVIKSIHPDVYVKGEEYRNIDIPEKEYADTIEYVPMIKGVSTTDMIKRIISLEG